MAKKGLITSLILGAVLTLSLGIYTLVAAIVANTTPLHETPIAYAYTSDQTITAFSDYSTDDGNLEIRYAEGQEDLLLFDSENNCTINPDKEYFIKAKAGEAFKFTAVATTDKHGSTKTFNVTVYKQGSGHSTDDSYVVANTEGLLELERKMDDPEEVNGIGRLLTDDIAGNGYVSLVESVDLTNIEWKGLAKSYARPFNDVFNAHGSAIKNMSIHITEQNYTEFMGTLTDSQGSYTALSVGFFRNTDGAIINGLSIENANIVIDGSVLALINPASNSSLEYIRAGLIVGDARNTTFDGRYVTTSVTTDFKVDTDESSETFGELIPYEKIEDVENRATVSGSINGYAFGRGYAGGPAINGLGGIAGVIHDYYSESSEGSKVANYCVDLSVNNSLDQENIFIGGVAGEILAGTNNISLEQIEAKLTSNAIFNNRNYIGALSGKVNKVDAKNIDTTIYVNDDSQKYAQFVAWHNSDQRDLLKLTDVAGIAAIANNSTFEDVTSNATINVYSNTAAGFYKVENSTLKNVVTSGSVTGYSASGLAQFLYESNVIFSADAESELVAADLDLSGWYTAAIADYARNSNITATGEVLVDVTINAKGKVAEGSTAIQNTLHSAGLVGYFYTKDTTFANEYVLSGFKVNALINNATDAAGLVAYLGNDATKANNSSKGLVVSNCYVTATITSNTGASRSSTHKVGGAVATIYGLATIDSVDVNICFNPVQTIGNKYGAAMFGGLVARVAGQYVTLNNNNVYGDAYINYTAYTKSYGDSEEYEQILAGGLVGVIASFGKNIPVGEHPVYGENTDEVLESATYDDVTCLNTNSIVISANTVDTDIVIDFEKENLNDGATCMGESGYRARAVGSLIGLVMNGIDSDLDGDIDTTTSLDLSTNDVTGSVSADRYTFTFSTTSTPVVGISSMGFGVVADRNAEAVSVGASFDLVANKQFTNAITWPAA